jgi:aromatic ring-cleaving dioxygenase
VPGKENPQALNRYAYVANNPLLFVDESGHCWGAFSFVRDINVGGYGYGTTCANIDQALTIVQHPDATMGEKALAGGYIGTQVVAHGTAVVGTTVAAVGCLTGAGTVICTGAGSAVTAASADGNPTNEVTAAANGISRLTSSATPHINQFWNRATNFMGNKVYQRNDLIDPNRVNNAGRTSLELMKSGRAPIGPDGQSMHLHHMLQTNQGPIAEMTRSFHQTYSRIIHINPNTTPSAINRATFSYWRQQYWIQRANDFIMD